MEDAKGLGRALSNYTDEYFLQVLLGFVVIYILYPFNLVLYVNFSGIFMEIFILKVFMKEECKICLWPNVVIIF